MPNTQEYITAKGDSDLLSRLIVRAEMMGVSDPANWVQINMAKLIQSSIAATPPAPGADLAAVTDIHLETAINAVLNPA